MTKQTLDFKNVDALRKAMLMTVGDMADFLGTSRETYYKWLAGGNIRAQNLAVVRSRLQTLLRVMKEHEWPTPAVISAKPRERYAMLKSCAYSIDPTVELS